MSLSGQDIVTLYGGHIIVCYFNNKKNTNVAYDIKAVYIQVILLVLTNIKTGDFVVDIKGIRTN